MPPRAKEHDHRVTHISQDEFLVILAFFFDMASLVAVDLQSNICSHLFGGNEPAIEYFSAISWVAVNLQSNTFQPPLWWHCRICQVVI